MATESENEQIEAIKEWWRKNGLPVVVAVVLGLAGLAGWHFWQQHQISQAQEGSIQYQRLLSTIQADKPKDAKRIGDELQKKYAGTPYAAQGALALAAFQVRQDNLEAAGKRLSWVIQHASSSDLTTLATLRRARVLQAMGKSDQAWKLVKSAKSGQYKSQFKEVEGDILAGDGKRKAAIKAYQSALEHLGDGSMAQGRIIKRKLQDLGGKVADS